MFSNIAVWEFWQKNIQHVIINLIFAHKQDKRVF